ncbi:CENP-B homolog protein 2-like [Rhizophagus clarus]|uniref:CENP-B homolog protein 2-like n=1 Tax=Rhizophagus clarus TaxID=94130 RepID=A0A8H3L604_9GLOM|nr:CENP-B homolog protein 2-like [Rhizophagus clarus]
MQTGLKKKKLQREAASANKAAIMEALPLLHNKCTNYPFEQIYNMDETELFYRLEPDQTLATKCLSNRKKSKERLSIALCSNADGSHKLPSLIIGKYANSRSFKNINICNLLMIYQNNAKLQDENLITLPHVEVHFLPPNTTSKIQLMDAKIIMSFKKHYCHHHICWLLEQVEAGQNIRNLKMDVLQAIQYIISSWNEVTNKTIYIFKNSVKNTNDLDEIDDSDEIVTISTSVALKSLELSICFYFNKKMPMNISN